MLNIKVKCNIFPIKTIKTLSYVINNVSSFIIFIIIRYKFEFANIAKIKIKIAKGVKCKDLFFLVNKTFKTFLKMLFICKIKALLFF